MGKPGGAFRWKERGKTGISRRALISAVIAAEPLPLRPARAPAPGGEDGNRRALISAGCASFIAVRYN